MTTVSSTVPVPRREPWRERLFSLLEPPRRIRPTKAGWLFTALSAAIAVAAMNTGNNILFIFLGIQFGLVAASGLWSETVLRGLSASAPSPGWVDAGRPAAIRYELRVKSRRWPAFVLQVLPDIQPVTDGPRTLRLLWRENRWWTPLERRQSGIRIVRSPWIRRIPPAGTAQAHVEVNFARRGLYRIQHLEVATLFPFGLIQKRKRIECGVEIVVAPEPVPASELGSALSASSDTEQTGLRVDPSGEFDGLRPFAPGDSPRMIAWKLTARTGALTVRLHRETLAPRVYVRMEPLRGGPADRPDPSEQQRTDRQARIARTLVETLRAGGYDVFLQDAPPVHEGLSAGEARLLATWDGNELPCAGTPGETLVVTRQGRVIRAS